MIFLNRINKQIMVIAKRKLRLYVYLFLALVLMLGIYFFQNSKFSREIQNEILIEQDMLPMEEIDIEIVSEENNWINDSIEEEIAEELIENDIEKLSINEELDETDIGNVNNEKIKTLALPAPLKRESDSDVLRIGFMTDLHVQSIDSKGRTYDNFYTVKMNYFVEKMNNVFSPNFILLNGDVIEGTKTSSEVGSRELSWVKNIFNRTTIKKYWVAGNHDLRSVNKNQWMSTLGIDYMSKSFDVGDYKIIILDGNFTKDDLDVEPGTDYLRGKVSQDQVDWLKKELEKTNKKTIIFMHHPPLRDIEAKNNLGLLNNARELQNIFSQYGVLAVFSGHIEDLYYQEIGGVDYYVSPGMVKYPKYLGAFSEITVNRNKISITLNYLLENGKYRSIEIEKE